MVRRIFDGGWLFLLAGLALCAAGILLPARQHVTDLRHQLHGLDNQQRLAVQRLETHARVLHELSNEDPALIKRLAAAHFNVVPAGERPVLRNTHAAPTLTAWIDQVVQTRQRAVRPVHNTAASDTTLARLVTGPYRLWVLAGGALCIFIGLILTPMLSRRPASNRNEHQPTAPERTQNHTTMQPATPRTRRVSRSSVARALNTVGVGFTAHASDEAVSTPLEENSDGNNDDAPNHDKDSEHDAMCDFTDNLFEMTHRTPTHPTSKPSQTMNAVSENIESPVHASDERALTIDDSELSPGTHRSPTDVPTADTLHDWPAAPESTRTEDESAELDADDWVEDDEDNDADEYEYEYVDADGNVIDDDDAVDDDAEMVEDGDEGDDADVVGQRDDDEEDDEDGEGDEYEYVWVDDEGNEIENDADDEWEDDEYDEDDDDDGEFVADSDDDAEEDDGEYEYEYVYVDDEGNVIDEPDDDDDDEWEDEYEDADDDGDEEYEDDELDDADVDDEYEYVWVDDDGNVIESGPDDEDEDERDAY